jgi:hypothetical protein
MFAVLKIAAQNLGARFERPSCNKNFNAFSDNWLVGLEKFLAPQAIKGDVY